MSTAETNSSFTLQRVLLIFTAFLLVVVCSLGLSAFAGKPSLFAGTRPDNLGVDTGRLVPCPQTSNCVSSQSQDDTHKIAPLTYTTNADTAIKHLVAAVQSFPRAKIITQTENYIYAEFVIPVFGFVDDVEFWLDNDAKVIDVRSASRLGESDLGVNRRRIESLRTKFNELAAST